jgi:NitT/TauT family transport system ATP-binding protein
VNPSEARFAPLGKPASAFRGIELVDVEKTYGQGDSARTVVSRCSLRVEPGRFTVMIGPSGAGKSTLVRLIAGFERPTAGEIRADGRPIRGPGKDRQVMFQETALIPWMTTAGNVSYGPRARGEFGPEAKRLAGALTGRMGLERFGKMYPAQLSGGMQRRAELARAMMNEPSVMILDEPFRGLDSMTKGLMLEYYADYSQESQRTNLFVTTDVDEAIFLADRVLVMTHIPTRVRAVVDIDLPRPRRLAALVKDERANSLKAELLALLHEEAAKAFATGGKETADFVEAYRRHHSSSPSATEKQP